MGFSDSGGPKFIGVIPGVVRLMVQRAIAPVGRIHFTANVADMDKEIWIMALGYQQTKRRN